MGPRAIHKLTGELWADQGIVVRDVPRLTLPQDSARGGRAIAIQGLMGSTLETYARQISSNDIETLISYKGDVVDRDAGCGDVREVVRAAVGQLAPDELPRFDEVWQAYLDDARDAAHILRSRHAALGAGMEVIATAMTPLIAAITGEALAGMVKEPAAGAVRKVAGRLGSGRKGRSARRAALSGPAPDPAALEHTVMRALFMDIARKAGCADRSAAEIADALVSVFTERPGAGGAAGPQMPQSPPEVS